MTGIESLPKIHLKEPYKRKPLSEHAMLYRGALHIKGIEGLVHPASSQMSQHIANGYFKGDVKGSGKY